MKILVLNCGSSSIKYKLFDMDSKSVIAQGGVEKIGLKDSFLKFTLPDGSKKILEKDIPEHTAGVQFILHTLIDPEYGAIRSMEEIDAVGHRMVHAGEKFSKSVLLTPEVLEAFTACNDLAPLHNPANLKGVNAIKAILPQVPQVGVFDTAFHQTMPDYAYLYAVPYELYTKYGVRRYGFHGTSHRYVSQRVCEFLGVKPEGLRIITCHIGNGGSITAVKDGRSIDTVHQCLLCQFAQQIFSAAASCHTIQLLQRHDVCIHPVDYIGYSLIILHTVQTSSVTNVITHQAQAVRLTCALFLCSDFRSRQQQQQRYYPSHHLFHVISSY